MLTQLAEERDAAGFKAARLVGMVEELRAEKKALLTKVARTLTFWLSTEERVQCCASLMS